MREKNPNEGHERAENRDGKTNLPKETEGVVFSFSFFAEVPRKIPAFSFFHFCLGLIQELLSVHK